MSKVNFDEFNPEIEDAGKQVVVKDTTAVDNFIKKCVDKYNEMEVGKSFTVPKSYMGKMTLAKRLRNFIEDTGKVRLVLRNVKDADGNVTATKVCKLEVKVKAENAATPTTDSPAV